MVHSQNPSRKDPGGTRPLVVKSFALTVGSSTPYPVGWTGWARFETHSPEAAKH
jgi:hypothetical protein